MQDKPRDSTVNAAVLARQTPGFSGAELSNLVNEAALLAAKTSKPSLSAELLDSARDKALMGVERRWVVTSHVFGTQSPDLMFMTASKDVQAESDPDD